MNNYRIYIEKKPQFQEQNMDLLHDFNESLNINITSIRVLSVYDLFDVEDGKLDLYISEVLCDSVSDNFYYDIDLTNKKYFGCELLPSQFCQRSSSALQCMKLVDNNCNAKVVSSQLFIFEGINDQDLENIKDYYINPVELREKDLNKLEYCMDYEVSPIEIVEGFIDLDELGLKNYCDEAGLSLGYDDLLLIQKYFIEENRNPKYSEILFLDTYWSDHCRHTTFNTIIDSIEFETNAVGKIIEKEFENYLEIKSLIGRKKDLSLMEIATISARYQKYLGNLQDVEESLEVNACSVFSDVDIDGRIEKWLVMFKNETHNHPTEIEPFGGAATCIGGAIRDLLASRGYVYQAMRISGSGNPFESVSSTLKGKLPQRKISINSAAGNSSYGNQIGVATTYVKEIVDESYKAKHLEVGMVVGAAKASNVIKTLPNVGDKVILLGGRTGRDGIGGATGSSKTHNDNSILQSSVEVQKGNATEERKIQRLFRNSEFTKLIKRCNDLGAGGISVSVGELADGISVNLDNVKLKDSSLNGLEIALSESQERMSLVVDSNDVNKVLELCDSENIDASVIGEVNDSNRFVMKWQGSDVVNISRNFLNTSGAKTHTTVKVENSYCDNIFKQEYGRDLSESIINMLKSPNIASQKGLVEMFDSTIGKTTVLMPFGGKNYLTQAQVGVQKIPVSDGVCNTCTIASYGFDPRLANISPFHSAMYAVVSAISKTVACGGDYQKMYFSFQEYFEKLTTPEKWGKALQSLLGANYALNGFNLASVGGKDSMSGTFNDLNVVPTLIAFGLCVGDVRDIISPEFKNCGNYIYLFKHEPLENGVANVESLKSMYQTINTLIKNKRVISAYSVEYGIAEALLKMSFGNDIGFDVNTDLELFNLGYGSIIVESSEKLDDAILLGMTSDKVVLNGSEFNLELLKRVWLNPYDNIYRSYDIEHTKVINETFYTSKKFKGQGKPTAYIPVFPGTNCEYDMQKTFERYGASCHMSVINNLDKEKLENSLTEMSVMIDNCNILVLSGGFSGADEPDGSGKYIANILKNSKVKASVLDLLKRGGLIIGICNGFQALVKTNLLPYGNYEGGEGVTLYKNRINRHISQFVTTKVMSNNSPWLSSFSVGDTYKIPVSHGEGRFVISEELAHQLFDNGQVAFCYCDENGGLAKDGLTNPNGSYYAIEGIVSPCGQIIGKMGHSERYEENLYKNVDGVEIQNLFKNAVDYFKEEE